MIASLAPVTDLRTLRAQATRDALERAKRLIVEGIDQVIAAMDDALALESAAQHASVGSMAEAAIDAHAVAAMVGRNVATVRELARSGLIPAHPVPGTGSRKLWLFYRSEIEAWIRSGASAADVAPRERP